jgi:hypothetical protein
MLDVVDERTSSESTVASVIVVGGNRLDGDRFDASCRFACARRNATSTSARAGGDKGRLVERNWAAIGATFIVEQPLNRASRALDAGPLRDVAHEAATAETPVRRAPQSIGKRRCVVFEPFYTWRPSGRGRNRAARRRAARQSVQPRLQTSETNTGDCVSMTSGAIQYGVPTRRVGSERGARRHAKVGEHAATSRRVAEHIGRLDVAMNDATRMHKFQRLADLSHRASRRAVRHRAAIAAAPWRASREGSACSAMHIRVCRRRTSRSCQALARAAVRAQQLGLGATIGR